LIAHTTLVLVSILCTDPKVMPITKANPIECVVELREKDKSLVLLDFTQASGTSYIPPKSNNTRDDLD